MEINREIHLTPNTEGKRKAGTRQGSLMCENNTCPKLLSEGIPNTNEFTKDSGVDMCKCCSYFVYRVYCRVVKVIEFDCEANMMTIIYEGKRVKDIRH